VCTVDNLISVWATPLQAPFRAMHMSRFSFLFYWCMISIFLPSVFGNAQDELLDSIVVRSLANEANSFRCEFKVKIGIANDKKQLLSGEFETVLGTAKGRWLKLNNCELYQFMVQDMVVKPTVSAKGGSKSYFVPFPGSETVIKNDRYVLYLNHSMGSGVIGKRDTYFPDQLFCPGQALGAVGTEKWADPLYYFIDPPQQFRHDIEVEGQTTLVTSTSSLGTLSTVFDNEKGFLVTSFSYTQGESTNRYVVSKTVKLTKNRFFPKVAHVICNDQDTFPVRTARWEMTSVSEMVDEGDLTFQIPGGRQQVRTNDNDRKFTHLASSSLVSASSLEKIFEAAAEKVPSVDLPKAPPPKKSADEANSKSDSSLDRIPTWVRYGSVAGFIVLFVVMVTLAIKRAV